MNVPVEEKKQEALLRMKKLGIFNQTIDQFDKSGKVSISEPPFGAFYWADGDDLDRIRQFEQDHNAMVYVVVRAYHRELGKMDAYLYVSDHPEEWEMDRADLADKTPFVYVYTHDAPDCSEFGSIGIELTPAAGLRRTV